MGPGGWFKNFEQIHRMDIVDQTVDAIIITMNVIDIIMDLKNLFYEASKVPGQKQRGEPSGPPTPTHPEGITLFLQGTKKIN